MSRQNGMQYSIQNSLKYTEKNQMGRFMSTPKEVDGVTKIVHNHFSETNFTEIAWTAPQYWAAITKCIMLHLLACLFYKELH